MTRLRAGRAWVVGVSGTVRERAADPWWETTATGPAPSAAELAERLVAAIPAGRRRLAVTLSGGWDSRVLAALAVRRRHHVEAWTTRQHEGRDQDLECSGPVAAALAGSPSTWWSPGATAWRGRAGAVHERFEHQSSHHVWMAPLAEAMAAQSRPILDGLAGDLVLRSRVAGLALAQSSRESGDWVEPMFTALGGRRLEHTAPEHAARLADAARAAWADEVAPFRAHAAGPVLAQLVSRTARDVALAPRLLFGPEQTVLTPYVDPVVLAPALRVPIAEKRDGGFGRAVLAATCGPTATLPSTNDPGVEVPVVPWGATAPAVIRSLAASVRDCPPALALLPAGVRSSVAEPVPVARLLRQPRSLEVLRWAGLLADWAGRYDDRLDWSGWPG